MIKLNVNGAEHELDTDPITPLLYVLRNELKLNGAKFGCGLGQCGACTVVVDDQPVFSCITPIALLEGRSARRLRAWARPKIPESCKRPSSTNRPRSVVTAFRA